MSGQRLQMAIQKKGRLFKESIDLLNRCGYQFHLRDNQLLCRVENAEMDLLLVRDDDIPTLVRDGICDIGIVGDNVLQEKCLQDDSYNTITISKRLGFAKCRLSIAASKNSSLQTLNKKRIATSYPNILRVYLQRQQIDANILELSGSVEIAPKLKMADAICDLVSTGRTLEENDLQEMQSIFDSEALLIHQSLSNEKNSEMQTLQRRIEAVIQAKSSKYIVFHAPKSALAKITTLLPGAEKPTVLQLDQEDDKVAVQVVAAETIFWDTLEAIKQAGASSILVLPIEKMMN